MADLTSQIHKDLEKVAAPLARVSAICANEVDIHTHTKELGALCRTIFNPIDARHLLSRMRPFSEVVSEIRKAAPVNRKVLSQEISISSILQTLASIEARGNTTEPETGLNIQELLVRTWTLDNHPKAPANALDLVFANLEHNVVAKGGCLAGISGRLIQPYCNFVQWILNSQFKSQQRLESERELLQKAQQDYLLLRRSSPFTGRRTMTTIEEENEQQLKTALDLSMQMAQPTFTAPAVPTVRITAPTAREKEKTELARVLELSKQMQRETREKEEAAQLAQALELSTRQPLVFTSTASPAASSYETDLDPDTVAMLKAAHGSNWNKPY